MARILLAEPDRAIREFIAGILTEFGHDVVACEQHRRSESVAGDSPDRCAGHRHGAAGRQGVALSRSSAALGIPTITLTGREFHADDQVYSAARRLLEKPFRFSDLQRVLNAVETLRPSRQRATMSARRRLISAVAAEMTIWGRSGRRGICRALRSRRDPALTLAGNCGSQPAPLFRRGRRDAPLGCERRCPAIAEAGGKSQGADDRQHQDFSCFLLSDLSLCRAFARPARNR